MLTMESSALGISLLDRPKESSLLRLSKSMENRPLHTYEGLPEFLGSKYRHVAPQFFYCPTKCGCEVEYQYTFYFSTKLLTSRSPAMLQWMAGRGLYDKVTSAIATKINFQCVEHSSYVGPKSLFAEIWHLHGNRHTYDCTCSIDIWFDDRDLPATRQHTIVDYSPCGRHAHLDVFELLRLLGQRALPTSTVEPLLELPEQQKLLALLASNG